MRARHDGTRADPMCVNLMCRPHTLNMCGPSGWNASPIHRRASSSRPRAPTGPSPTLPLAFPKPLVRRAVMAWTCLTVDGVATTGAFLNGTDRTYLVQSKLADSTHGCVYRCAVLQRRPFQRGEWATTRECVALKCSTFDRMNETTGSNPWKEAACLLFLGHCHAHILGCIDVWRDDACLYVVLPYCGNSLESVLAQTWRGHETITGSCKAPSLWTTSTTSDWSDSRRVPTQSNEDRARVWFVQLLAALRRLQDKGVYHGNLNPSKLLLEDDNLVIVGFGRCHRVPYRDRSNVDGVADVSEGVDRLPLLAGSPKFENEALAFIDPEVLAHGTTVGVDGFAADVWSAGVLLHVFLTGTTPVREVPRARWDDCGAMDGRLRDVVSKYNEPLSELARDLLQGMLYINPRERLTLAEVMNHDWTRESSGTMAK